MELICHHLYPHRRDLSPTGRSGGVALGVETFSAAETGTVGGFRFGPGSGVVVPFSASWESMTGVRIEVDVRIPDLGPDAVNHPQRTLLEAGDAFRLLYHQTEDALTLEGVTTIWGPLPDNYVVAQNPPLDMWATIGFEVDPTGAWVSVNGEVVAEAPDVTSLPMIDPEAEISIGAAYGSGIPPQASLLGDISEIKVWRDGPA